jgi:hypothetical protein
VRDETAGEIVYTLRIAGHTFRPPVFSSGPFTVEVGEPGTPRLKTLKDVQPASAPDKRIEVRF